MKVRCIKIKNVRSFKEETVFEPREDYNVLIGSNGSGKSNLMDVIYVTLRHYFLRSYQQAKSRKENGLNVQLNYITDPCGKIERVLPKYAGSTGPSDIKITLEITKADTNTNVSPSMHVLGTLAATFALWNTDRFQTKQGHAALAVITVLICVSTVFVKQHSVLDIIAALPISAVAWLICFRRKERHSKKKRERGAVAWFAA